MNEVLLMVLVLLAPSVLVALAIGRLLCAFAAVGRLFDRGERAVGPLVDRIAQSMGTPSVSMVLPLSGLDEGDDTVSAVRRFLGQRYRNLELILVSDATGVPTELSLAFDLVEAGTSSAGTVFRSRRDERLSCVLAGTTSIESDLWNAGLAATSGALVCPVDPRWQLRPFALAAMSSAWLRRPDTTASAAVLHRSNNGLRARCAVVSLRADAVALAGLGSGQRALSALGSLAAGHQGSVVGIFERATLERIGGVVGPIADPQTWNSLVRRLQHDGEERSIEHRVEIHTDPVGRVPRPAANRRRLFSGAAPQVGLSLLVAVSVLSAVVGVITGLVAADTLWIAASAPIVSISVIVLTLIMDDRTGTSAAGTMSRVMNLLVAPGAAMWGVVGSPLGWPPGNLYRA